MTTENKTNDDLKPYKGFLPCRICNYSAPPVLVKTERKHFDAHSYECTRCLFKPETKANQDQALSAWNTRADCVLKTANPEKQTDLSAVNEKQLPAEKQAALDFCDMVLEIGEPDNTVIPVWPIETEMALTHPLTVGMVRIFKTALTAPQPAPVLDFPLKKKEWKSYDFAPDIPECWEYLRQELAKYYDMAEKELNACVNDKEKAYGLARQIQGFLGYAVTHIGAHAMPVADLEELKDENSRLKRTIAGAAHCILEGKTGINDTIWFSAATTLFEHLVSEIDVDLTGNVDEDIQTLKQSATIKSCKGENNVTD